MALTINVYSWFYCLCIFSLGAISGLFSEKVGIVNLGINGMMVIGASLSIRIVNTPSKFDGNGIFGMMTNTSNTICGWLCIIIPCYFMVLQPLN